jgi:hypothetical protein
MPPLCHILYKLWRRSDVSEADRQKNATRHIQMGLLENVIVSGVIMFHWFYFAYVRSRGSRWPRDLMRGCAAARLLGLWVRIPPGAWMSVVSVVWYQVEISASGCSLVQRRPTDCGVSECDRETSIMMRPWPTGVCCAMVYIIHVCVCVTSRSGCACF